VISDATKGFEKNFVEGENIIALAAKKI